MIQWLNAERYLVPTVSGFASAENQLSKSDSMAGGVNAILH